MTSLEVAIILAVRAHKGQVDKGGEPYILHPLRVMMRMGTDEERVVAVLHDALEDTTLTTEDLRSAGFSEMIIGALEALTRRENEHGVGIKEVYLAEFIPRIAKNSLARAVKLADLEDNMDPNRAPPNETDNAYASQMRKYAKAKTYLLKSIEIEQLERQLKKAKEELG